MVISLLSTSARAVRTTIGTLVVVGTALAPLAEVLSPPVVSVSVEGGQDQDVAALIAGLSAAAPRDRAMAACRLSRLRGQDLSAALQP
ncbi:MAG: hypothetical protein PVJ49_12185, partial [Acidobacteriota bacterium]